MKEYQAALLYVYPKMARIEEHIGQLVEAKARASYAGKESAEACAEKMINYLCAKDCIAFARTALEGRYPAPLLQPATDESFGTEFLDYKMAIRTVDSPDEALRHIARYGSKHSECIVSEREERIARFLRTVDAACVYANVSTAFTDGAQFGLGAEIGISTQKLHARGPMALAELCTYKWIIRGDGQVRE